jgi:hypothetical protein
LDAAVRALDAVAFLAARRRTIFWGGIAVILHKKSCTTIDIRFQGEKIRRGIARS